MLPQFQNSAPCPFSVLEALSGHGGMIWSPPPFLYQIHSAQSASALILFTNEQKKYKGRSPCIAFLVIKRKGGWAPNCLFLPTYGFVSTEWVGKGYLEPRQLSFPFPFLPPVALSLSVESSVGGRRRKKCCGLSPSAHAICHAGRVHT